MPRQSFCMQINCCHSLKNVAKCITYSNLRKIHTDSHDLKINYSNIKAVKPFLFYYYDVILDRNILT